MRSSITPFNTPPPHPPVSSSSPPPPPPPPLSSPSLAAVDWASWGFAPTSPNCVPFFCIVCGIGTFLDWSATSYFKSLIRPRLVLVLLSHWSFLRVNALWRVVWCARLELFFLGLLNGRHFGVCMLGLLIDCAVLGADFLISWLLVLDDAHAYHNRIGLMVVSSLFNFF